MTEQYYRAEVLAVTSTERVIEGQHLPKQEVLLRLQTGGTPVDKEIVHEGDELSGDFRIVAPGQHVVVLRVDDGETANYSIFDVDRTNSLIGFSVAFLLLVIIFGRKKGLLAMVGAVAGLLVLVLYVVPHLLMGESPIVVAMIGSVAIACSSMLLAHGLRRRTWVALAGTLIVLACVAVLSWLAVHVTQLTGIGTDETFLFQFGPAGSINMQGLLLAGIIIGALGALDDVTTAQSAVVSELKEANPALDFRELYKRGTSVGQEHIASLVNTLLLAYVGASLPLFILLSAKSSLPLWVSLNSEFLAQEIVRTLAGSAGLVLAVPLTTMLAAWVETRQRKSST